LERRSFLKGAALGGAMATLGGGVGRPALAQGNARVLRFVPQADLANFDPIWGSQYVVRNAGLLVWDTLYGVDETMTPRRQMVESEEVSPDGLVWTFRLRTGLKFHDGEPVLSRDAVASLKRWAVRDPMGQMILAIENELSTVDDRMFRWSLKQPFPKMLLALGKNNAPCTFVMPERIARTDPFQQIREYVGSGPMRFIRDEWVPGARAAFQKFDGYVPRDEPASWMAGGKRILMDRVEWSIVPDAATAAGALQSGEVDWLETPLADLIPLLKRNRNVTVDIADPLGNICAFRMNHLHAPFNSQKIRRAILMALDQEDYTRAVVGDDPALRKPLPGFFTPGTPLYTEAGGDILKGPRDIEGAKRLLAEGGYNNEPVVCMISQDLAPHKAMGDVTAELLKRLGMNVEYVATDWGTVVGRRASKEPTSKGGWSMFHTWHSGADCASPAGYAAIRGNADKAWFGWPDSPGTEAGIADWYKATSLEQEKAAIARTNQAALEDVVYAPLGLFLAYQAWRTNVSGIVKGPAPFFWNVSKS
jgi:peptide/nickel transport system substrate-binding protein